MASVASLAQTIERNDLASFLKTPRLVKQMENVVKDVAETLPNAIDQISVDVESAQATADAAILAAAAAQATADGAVIDAAVAQATVDALALRDVPLALADGPVITVDAFAHNTFSVTLGGNRTLSAPTNLADGMLLNFAIRQDATGGRTLSFAAIYDFGSAGTPTLSTAPDIVDRVFGQYDAASNKILATFRSGSAPVVVPSACFSAHNNGAAQSIPNNAFTKLTLGTEVYDTGNYFSGSTWTPPAGKLISLVGAVLLPTTAAGLVTVAVYKNGAEYKRGGMVTTANTTQGLTVSCQDLPNGTDTYELWAYQSSGVAQNTNGGSTLTYFQGTTVTI